MSLDREIHQTPHSLKSRKNFWYSKRKKNERRKSLFLDLCNPRKGLPDKQLFFNVKNRVRHVGEFSLNCAWLISVCLMSPHFLLNKNMPFSPARLQYLPEKKKKQNPTTTYDPSHDSGKLNRQNWLSGNLICCDTKLFSLLMIIRDYW